MKRIKLTQDKFAQVDDKDYKWLNQWKWRIEKNRNYYYAIRVYQGKRISMHQLILNAPKGLFIDHKNCNGLDNRQSNLRLCTRQQNLYNQRIKVHSSKYKGVTRRKDCNRWQACIKQNGKDMWLGNYEKEEDAAKAYNIKARELFGEFARLNDV